MNYRHAYHAGNFADVMKHVVLALVIAHFKQKPAPFRVIDTHAGIGAYDLSGEEAQKTAEASDGIVKVMGARFSPDVSALLADYLDVVRSLNSGGEIIRYPGSPLLARSLVRGCDSIVANEFHGEDHLLLSQLFRRDEVVKVMGIDGWVALKSLLPPKERRGIILVDPPFEERDEFERMAQGLRDGLHRFRTGCYLLWYPIKGETACDVFNNLVRQSETASVLNVTFMIRAARDTRILNGCGMTIVNPPFELDRKLQLVMPALARVLRRGDGARADVTWFKRST